MASPPSPALAPALAPALPMHTGPWDPSFPVSRSRASRPSDPPVANPSPTPAVLSSPPSNAACPLMPRVSIPSSWPPSPCSPLDVLLVPANAVNTANPCWNRRATHVGHASHGRTLGLLTASPSCFVVYRSIWIKLLPHISCGRLQSRRKMEIINWTP